MVGAGTDGFFLQSADTAFQVKLRGYTQLDSRWFSRSDDDHVPDSFYFRRVRPIVEGTLAGFVDFRIMPDFANSTLVLQDAYANLRFVARGAAPGRQVQVAVRARAAAVGDRADCSSSARCRRCSRPEPRPRRACCRATSREGAGPVPARGAERRTTTRSDRRTPT